jgi:hypothetical protein
VNLSCSGRSICKETYPISKGHLLKACIGRFYKRRRCQFRCSKKLQEIPETCLQLLDKIHVSVNGEVCATLQMVIMVSVKSIFSLSSLVCEY